MFIQRALLLGKNKCVCLGNSFPRNNAIVCRILQKRHKTSKSSAADFIRWNYENKLLFGPLQKVKSNKNVTASTARTKRNNSPQTPAKSERTKTTSKNDEKSKSFTKSENIPRLSRITKDKLARKDTLTTWWNEDLTTDSFQKSNFGKLDDAILVKNDRNTSDSFIKTLSTNFPGNSDIVEEKNELNLEPLPVIPDSLEYISQCKLLSTSEDTEVFFRFKRYVEQLSFRTLPTVNSIISNTQTDMSKFFLQRWREKMIGELGQDGFKVHQENTYRNGIQLHANIQQYLSGMSVSDIQIMPGTRKYWDSLEDVLPWVKDVIALETSVTHPLLFYKGTFDCVALYRDTLCVIDWKTSSKPKPLLSNTFDNPLQVAAYVGAINSSQMLQSKGVDEIRNALIVVTYADGHPAHVHPMDQATCTLYWQKWLERIRLYYSTFKKNT